jgi:hypothetical protein
MANASSSNDDTFQVGLTANPAQIISIGGVYDEHKKLNSCRLLVCDAESLIAIRALEAQTQSENPHLTLDSCIADGSEVDPNNPANTGYVVRCKVTKNEKCYRATDPWGTGAAPELSLLAYGHTLVAKCRMRPWTYQENCGITIYVNLLRGIGVNNAPWGLPVKGDGPVVTWD